MHAEEGPSVLFVMPPGGVIPYFAEHLGTAYLRAMLARAGIGSAQYLPERNVALAAFARFLAERRPPVVGFTAYESNLRACRAMARAVRETLPESVVVVGGPNATFSPEETLERTPADVCLRGAGEGTIVGVVRAILGTDRARQRLADLLADVPNLVIRTPAGLLRTRAGDLSSFPSLYFRCLDDIPSPYQAGIVTTADVGLLTARGCNQHCTYCSFAAISGRRVHHHGVERVLEDLAAFKAVVDRVERRRPTIAICDDAFTLAPSRARAICEGIVSRGLQMPFECGTRADRVDADLLRLMRRAGFVTVAFGLESAVPRVLRAIGKVQDPATRDDPGLEAERAFLASFRGAVAAAKEAGLSPSVSVIGGLPGETADDFRETLAFVESLGVRSYAHNVLAAFPGTPLFRDGERYGIRVERQAHSGRWRTIHAYDVGSVPPLESSMTRAARWEEANQIADALCGRPRPEGATDDVAWAVVLHAGAPDPEVSAWLAAVLPVHGTLVVVNAEGPCGPSDLADWLRFADGMGVPLGLVAVLAREDAPGGRLVLRSAGTLGDHRFEIGAPWSSTVESDRSGNCRVPIWIGSAATVPPSPAGADGPFAPVPQIADGCRWWSGWRRCRQPRVLHVWSDSTVTPCWNGPALGRVGDGYAELAARGAALRPAAAPARQPDRCPQAREGEEDRRAASAAETYEVAAQLCWLLPRGTVQGRCTEPKQGGETWAQGSFAGRSETSGSRRSPSS
jgi:radical SAM superfamily enzyme YgiQ (UPF0313 family)